MRNNQPWPNYIQKKSTKQQLAEKVLTQPIIWNSENIYHSKGQKQIWFKVKYLWIFSPVDSFDAHLERLSLTSRNLQSVISKIFQFMGHPGFLESSTSFYSSITWLLQGLYWRLILFCEFYVNITEFNKKCASSLLKIIEIMKHFLWKHDTSFFVFHVDESHSFWKPLTRHLLGNTRYNVTKCLLEFRLMKILMSYRSTHYSGNIPALANGHR